MPESLTGKLCNRTQLFLSVYPDKCIVGYGDHPPLRVPVHFAESVKLLHVKVAQSGKASQSLNGSSLRSISNILSSPASKPNITQSIENTESNLQTSSLKMHKISKLAVLTSGGDAPGMNPCIRSVVRTAIYNNLNVVGIRRGYQGLIEDDMFDMEARSVSNILNLGGTILKTARCLPFRTDEGMEIAYQNLKKQGVNALVVIGGDGTFTGALRFSKKYPDIAVIGVPGTIDNDLYGSTYTLGFDTATNTVIEAIDKIRDT
eukprot:gene13720-15924_t